MNNYQGSNGPLFSAYPAGPVHDDSPMKISYQYTSGEPSSSALTRNLPDSSSQSYLPSDLPELYYDQSWPSPPSATSLNMVSTPPPDWQMSWQLPESKCASNDPHYLPSRWQAPFYNADQGTRPTVAPIDTNCSWNKFHQKTTGSPSILFDSYEEFDPGHQINPYSTSYPQPASLDNTKTMSNFGFSPSSAVSSANTSLAVLPDPVPTSSSCPPTMGQVPLKLHQPRPSRRIPIISLSHLASACDAIPSHSKQPNFNASDKNLHASRPSMSSMSSFAAAMDPSSNQFNTQPFLSRNNPAAYMPTFQMGNPNNNPTKVITCSCGCGQSTTSYT